MLTQPGQPARRIALQRRDNKDCLIEELRRLDPDEVYEASLNGLGKISSGTAKPAPAKKAAPAAKKAPAAKTAKSAS